MHSLFTLGADNPLGHVVDKPLIGGGDTPVILTLHMVTMFAATFLTLWVLSRAAKAIMTGPESQGADRYITKGSLGQMIEVFCLYLREKVVRPQLGADTDRFIPYLWTVFFFILFNNLLGLIPLLDLQHLIGYFFLNDSHWAVIGGTATGNFAVTCALAIIAFVVIQLHGIRQNGVMGYLKHYTAGAPVGLWPIMIPVEILGTFIKPFALAIRLFANMVAGHTLLATLLMFTKMALDGVGLFGGAPITLLAIVAAIAITFLELFVALLQAYVFMFLVTVFIAQLSHHGHGEHDHAHGHGHDHDHAPGHAHGHAAAAH